MSLRNNVMHYGPKKDTFLIMIGGTFSKSTSTEWRVAKMIEQKNNKADGPDQRDPSAERKLPAAFDELLERLSQSAQERRALQQTRQG